jgi:hypothetical protein
MEARNIAQRYAILFCVKLGESGSTRHGKLQAAFGDEAMSRAQAFRWHKMFSEGRTIVEDKSWFFKRDPETKRQNLEWRSKESSRPKKALMSKSKLNSMLV